MMCDRKQAVNTTRQVTLSTVQLVGVLSRDLYTNNHFRFSPLYHRAFVELNCARHDGGNKQCVTDFAFWISLLLRPSFR